MQYTMEDILEEYPDITEKQLEDIAEEIRIDYAAAVQALERKIQSTINCYVKEVK